LTAVRVPEKLDAKEILRRLSSEFGITIAGGQGELQGQILRIAHLGFIQKDDLIKGLMALETVLSKMGHSVKRGHMTSAFNRALKIVSQQDFERPVTL
jgi:aspartate aminotransferase-like enzyme